MIVNSWIYKPRTIVHCKANRTASARTMDNEYLPWNHSGNLLAMWEASIQESRMYFGHNSGWNSAAKTEKIEFLEEFCKISGVKLIWGQKTLFSIYVYVVPC